MMPTDDFATLQTQAQAQAKAQTQTQTSPHAVRYLDLLSRAVAYIDANLAAPLDGDTLAGVATMSRFHFQRVFRAYFGTTVAGYVTWRRLRRACELLAENPVSVLDVALEVGYESSQALAKAMRRELDTTPVAVRAGDLPQWRQLFDRRAAPPLKTHDPAGAALLNPRLTDLRALAVLAATGLGMVDGDMRPAAQQAFGELIPALATANLSGRAAAWLSLFPDEPEGPDDQQARMLCGAVFDHALFDHALSGGLYDLARPPIELRGTLAWWYLPAGRYAVFTHKGAHHRLHQSWLSVYRDWLPATGYALRDVPSFEHYVNDPRQPLGDAWRTDLYLPLN